MTPTFAERVLEFHQNLSHPRLRIRGVKSLYPYRDPAIRDYAGRFHRKYYSDSNPRIFVFGINPGRFGAGTTGIPFTDPVALQEACGIANDLPKKRELSSVYIYSFIDRWGGPEAFYRLFFFAAVSPIGFIKDGKNYNYYDDTRLLKSLQPFILASMRKQLHLGARREVAIVLGTGRNRFVFERLNDAHGFFLRVRVVEHPRFIMQYRRRKLDDYLARYHEVFTQAVRDCG